MLSYAAICIASASIAALTLYSGFGIGTLLMPVFAIFLPVEVAVGATAIVHAMSNVFKIAMVGRLADMTLVLKFGVPAAMTAMLGAGALGYMSHLESLLTYSIGSYQAIITPIKLVMAAVIMTFALFDLIPSLKKLKFNQRYLVAGGMLSGFFGGLSGHQGALRSAFLVKTDISTESFVGTNAVIGFMVDISRIVTYLIVFLQSETEGVINSEAAPIILTGTLSAFAGITISRKFLRKVTMTTVQMITGILLFAIALAMGLGLI